MSWRLFLYDRYHPAISQTQTNTPALIDSSPCPSGAMLLPATTRRASRLTHFPLLIITTILIFPTIIGLSNSPDKSAVADAGIIREKRGPYGSRYDLQGRQTIADMSIEVDDYSWGGDGDGTDTCKRWSHQCRYPDYYWW